MHFIKTSTVENPRGERLCPGGRERVYPHRSGRRQRGAGADRQGAEEAASPGGEADCRTGRVNQETVRGKRHREDTRQAFQPPVGGVRHRAERIGAGGGGTERGHHRPGRGPQRFVSLVRRYTSFDELTTPMLNEFIEKVVVHEADKSTGDRRQKVDIYFNFIGCFVPPKPEVILTAEEEAKAQKALAARNREREQNRLRMRRVREAQRAAKEAGEVFSPAG